MGREGPLVVEEYRVDEDAEGGMHMVQTNKDKQAKQQKDGKDSVKALLREARENGAMTEDDWFEFLRRAGIERAELKAKTSTAAAVEVEREMIGWRINVQIEGTNNQSINKSFSVRLSPCFVSS